MVLRASYHMIIVTGKHKICCLIIHHRKGSHEYEYRIDLSLTYIIVVLVTIIVTMIVKVGVATNDSVINNVIVIVPKSCTV